ncbi:MAG: flagella basal body P-ring formation protein FlgA [Planctomycetota bacterium]|nr:MAG: flagella basal body P-ring formation protein FlgA [Planctomycetota bacterium]
MRTLDRIFRTRLLSLCLIAAAVHVAAPADAAEILLRPTAVCRSATVTLGDVAEVRDSDRTVAENLSRTALVPAPAPGERRFITRRQVEEVLVVRGLDMRAHRLEGANMVEVTRPAVVNTSAVQSISQAVASRAKRLVEEAVARHLAEVSGESGWDVACRFDANHAALLADPHSQITVRGGTPPYTGTQRFDLVIDNPAGRGTIPVVAEVTPRRAVVVAVRSLPRGAIIRREDVALSRDVDANTAADPDVCRSLEEVIGKEVATAIGQNRILTRSDIRLPVLVRRNDVVTVYVRASGIRIRTVGRATAEGSQGDLVEVESLDRKRRFYARVSGFQEVEVFARGVQVNETAAR